MSTDNHTQDEGLPPVIPQAYLEAYLSASRREEKFYDLIVGLHQKGGVEEPGDWEVNKPVPPRMAPLVVPRTRPGTKSSEPIAHSRNAAGGPEGAPASDAALRASAMEAWRARKDAMLRAHDYSAYPDLLRQYFNIQFFSFISRSFVRLGLTCPAGIVKSLRRYGAAG
jgi:hypothetical protein